MIKCRALLSSLLPACLTLFLALCYNAHKKLYNPRMLYPNPSQLLEETEGTGRYFTRPSDGKQLEYHLVHDEGQNKSMMAVLLHDIQVTGNHWCKYRPDITNDFFSPTSFNASLLCPLFPGFGASEPYPAEYTAIQALDAFADDLEALIQFIKGKRKRMNVGLLGIGWGVEPAFYTTQRMMRLVRENALAGSTIGRHERMWEGLRVGSVVSVYGTPWRTHQNTQGDLSAGAATLPSLRMPVIGPLVYFYGSVLDSMNSFHHVHTQQQGMRALLDFLDNGFEENSKDLEAKMNDMPRATRYSYRGVVDAVRWFYNADRELLTNYTQVSSPTNGTFLKTFVLHQTGVGFEENHANDFFRKTLAKAYFYDFEIPMEFAPVDTGLFNVLRGLQFTTMQSEWTTKDYLKAVELDRQADAAELFAEAMGMEDPQQFAAGYIDTLLSADAPYEDTAGEAVAGSSEPTDTDSADKEAVKIEL